LKAIYVMLTTLTSEGRKTLKERPERIKEVNQEVEKMGVKILRQYAVLGDLVRAWGWSLIGLMSSIYQIFHHAD